jgi:hypothetical protein
MAVPPPVIPSSDDRTKSWLTLAGGLAATAAVVIGLVLFWPDGDDDSSETQTTDVLAEDDSTTTTKPRTGTGEPSEQTTLPSNEGTVTTEAMIVADDLFLGDLPAAYADLLGAAGNPAQIIELAVYDSYAYLAYRDPANPGNIDRRTWRDGEVSDPEPNTIEDRVNPETEPSLFEPGVVDAALIAQLIADAPTHYDLATEVTHVLIDRFLPFDERVLIRVYASPTDGRSGGGYVSYDTAGTFVKVCC